VSRRCGTRQCGRFGVSGEGQQAARGTEPSVGREVTPG